MAASGDLKKIKCTVQYNGTAYAGFQRQREGEPTIQGAIEEAITSLTGETVPIVAAGRTDAGVHAHGQVFHFSTRSRIPVDRWPAAFNTRLPRDIVVVDAEVVPPTFHARFDARARTYRYSVWNADTPSPFWYPFSWWVRQPLDVERMREGASHLVGRHDFAAFAAAGSSARTTERTLFRVDVEEESVGPKARRLIHVWVEGDAFLYRMVRNIVGTLVVVGAGEEEPDWVRRVLKEGRREAAGATAPPQGLTLWRVDY